MDLTAQKEIQMNTRHWQIIWWFLFVVWVTCAILNMKHIPAGLLTIYGADLTIPAWFYIATRYPNGLPEITPREAFFKEDAEACLESAGAIFQKVRALIS